MSDFVLVWEHKESLLRVIAASNALAGQKKFVALSRAVNHTGDKVNTQVRRAISKRTSVPPMALEKYGALKKRLSTPATLTYEIKSSGKGIPYKAMGARQTRVGVSVMAWGRRFVIPHAFIGQGSLNGNVFIRRGSSRHPIKALTGPSIPKELVKHYVDQVFHTTVTRELPPRVEHEVRRLTNGIFA